VKVVCLQSTSICLGASHAAGDACCAVLTASGDGFSAACSPTLTCLSDGVRRRTEGRQAAADDGVASDGKSCSEAARFQPAHGCTIARRNGRCVLRCWLDGGGVHLQLLHRRSTPLSPLEEHVLAAVLAAVTYLMQVPPTPPSRLPIRICTPDPSAQRSVYCHNLRHF